MIDHTDAAPDATMAIHLLTLLRTCALALVVAYGVGHAQPAAQSGNSASPTAPISPSVSTSPSVPTTKSATANAKSAGEEARERGAARLAECLRDWDAATHMTKKEWERTCRRATQERVKFLTEQAK